MFRDRKTKGVFAIEGNLIVDNVISVYEGEFKPGYVKRNEARQYDGFCLYLEGGADYIFENGPLSVEAGDVLFLPKGANYNIMVKKPSEWICIDFLFRKKELPPYVSRNEVGIKHEFYKFQYNWITNSSVRIPRAFELINRIYRQLIISNKDAQSNSHAIFSKAVEMVLQHYKDPDFTVKSLAESLNISTVHLRRIFSHHIDKSPVKYINDMRLEQAKILLRSSNLTIGEIALSLGFADQFYFSKSFKATVGLTPTQYRSLNTHESVCVYSR